MNGLSLFTGSGIGDLALKHIIPDYKTVCYVEWDKYCQQLIQARIKDGVLCDAPIWDDVRTFDGTRWAGKVDIVFGGFPCQPFSVAGKNKGADDERNMWPDTLRIISEVRPRYACLENVPNLLIHDYARIIFAGLASIGYDCEWDIVSAAFVGAPHIRKRIWILAHANGKGASRLVASSNISIFRQGRWCGKKNLQDWIRIELIDPYGYCGNSPVFCRAADGIPDRMDRIKVLGNAWVPQVVNRILRVEELK